MECLRFARDAQFTGFESKVYGKQRFRQLQAKLVSLLLVCLFSHIPTSRGPDESNPEIEIPSFKSIWHSLPGLHDNQLAQ